MGKASEIWKEIKPKIGEMLMAVNDVETQAEKAQEAAYAHGYSNAEIKYRTEVKEAYQKGLSDAWEAARKIVLSRDDGGIEYEVKKEIFGHTNYNIIREFNVFEVIEEIRAHEQAQKEKEEQKKEQSVTAEEVMRQYLDTFCSECRACGACILNTSDFTCGRGYHFLTDNRVSDEEVRRAYAVVLAKMKES